MLASSLICISLALLVPLAHSQTGHSSLQGAGAAGSHEAAPGNAANFSLLIPVECGYGFRNGKLCPGYPRFVSSSFPSWHTRTSTCSSLLVKAARAHSLTSPAEIVRRLALTLATTERLLGE